MKPANHKRIIAQLKRHRAKIRQPSRAWHRQPREGVARGAGNAGFGDDRMSTLADATHHLDGGGRHRGVAAGGNGFGGIGIDNQVSGDVDARISR